MKSGLDRARALAKASRRDYDKRKANAEATVVRWEWASAPRFHPEPAHYQTRKIPLGIRLPREPKAWKLGQAHEGFDASDRLVVQAERTMVRGIVLESFFRYARGGIEDVTYASPSGNWIIAVWHTVKAGRVVASDGLNPLGGYSREYRYDDRARMIRSLTHGVEADRPWERTYEYDYAQETLVRVWSVSSDGRRALHWRPRKR